MSANTLTNRVTGSTILDVFFNDIHSALDGDFVGRGATGIPTAGQNLGTPALPWGSVYAGSMILNGTPIDTTKIVSPPNRIVSGAKRSTSNQPLFIVPNGAAASFILKATTTPLVIDVNGASVTFSADVTKAGLTTAPASSNTATINDSTTAGQAATRTWGEYNGKKITISSAGTNITTKVGTFQTFKVVDGGITEYFIAFVESSTVLSHCYRGFFFDSSSNPIKRVVLNNADTITIMSQGFVFATNDGTSLDVSYTTPSYSTVAPTSPATGDYWYDLVNKTWKRYDGTTFQIINRTLVGMVAIDSSNCVAARSFDFYAAYSNLNTVQLEVSSTATVARALKQGARINVAGNDINFGQSLPQWVGSNNYVGSTDYYAAFTTSTTYYLYIKDDGSAAISDVEPLFRSDLYGRYHPSNPWRCVGMGRTDGSSNWIWVADFSDKICDFKTSLGSAFGYAAGFGTIASSEVFCSKEGRYLVVNGYFNYGTVSATDMYITLPAGMVIDANTLTTTANMRKVGMGVNLTSSATQLSLVRFDMMYDGSNTDRVFFVADAQSHAYKKTQANGASAGGSNDFYQFEFKVPIVGWTD